MRNSSQRWGKSSRVWIRGVSKFTQICTAFMFHHTGLYYFIITGLFQALKMKNATRKRRGAMLHREWNSHQACPLFPAADVYGRVPSWGCVTLLISLFGLCNNFFRGFLRWMCSMGSCVLLCQHSHGCGQCLLEPCGISPSSLCHGKKLCKVTPCCPIKQGALLCPSLLLSLFVPCHFVVTLGHQWFTSVSVSPFMNLETSPTSLRSIRSS